MVWLCAAHVHVHVPVCVHACVMNIDDHYFSPGLSVCDCVAREIDTPLMDRRMD